MCVECTGAVLEASVSTETAGRDSRPAFEEVQGRRLCYADDGTRIDNCDNPFEEHVLSIPFERIAKVAATVPHEGDGELAVGFIMEEGAPEAEQRLVRECGAALFKKDATPETWNAYEHIALSYDEPSREAQRIAERLEAAHHALKIAIGRMREGEARRVE